MPTPESLIQPQGPLDPSFFPDDEPPPATGAGSLLDRLAVYITRAEAKAGAPDAEPAVTNWALHLAFEDAHALMAARPASETYMTGLGGHAYNAEQLKFFARKAAEYAILFEQALATAPASMPTSATSRTTPNKFEW